MIRVLTGDCREILPTLAARSVQCCVTSPPYWGLRDYGIDSQLGLEFTLGEYITDMAHVFREVWRVLRDDGTLWLNMGDSYATSLKFNHGLKSKDLCGVPWRLAFALQADGWYLRSDIIWHKSNPMPESGTDRPTKAHEYIFLLTKNERYFYDADAIREPHLDPKVTIDEIVRLKKRRAERNGEVIKGELVNGNVEFNSIGRNKRSVWTVATQPYAEAHFATFPEDLIKPCILAGSRLGDTVLDPFSGSGTTGKVALELGRKTVLIEINPAYVQFARDRTCVTPGFL